jgi:hypothetical protein
MYSELEEVIKMHKAYWWGCDHLEDRKGDARIILK